MTDYEALILQRQEELEIWEDIIEEHYSDLYLRYINNRK
jgi:hypothetical protein